MPFVHRNNGRGDTYGTQWKILLIVRRAIFVISGSRLRLQPPRRSAMMKSIARKPERQGGKQNHFLQDREVSPGLIKKNDLGTERTICPNGLEIRKVLQDPKREAQRSWSILSTVWFYPIKCRLGLKVPFSTLTASPRVKNADNPKL